MNNSWPKPNNANNENTKQNERTETWSRKQEEIGSIVSAKINDSKVENCRAVVFAITPAYHVQYRITTQVEK